MDYRNALIAAALALGLAGCASYSSGYGTEAVYRDGSYYSPSDAGYGDYYYAPEPRDYYYDYYGQDPFYGSPLYGYGGYCSVRYRYCPPFGYGRFPDSGWYAPYGAGFGYGFGYYPAPYYGGYRQRSHDRDRRRAAPRPSSPDGMHFPGAPPRRPQAQPRPTYYPTPPPPQQRSDSTGSSQRSEEDRREYRRRSEGN